MSGRRFARKNRKCFVGRAGEVSKDGYINIAVRQAEMRRKHLGFDRFKSEAKITIVAKVKRLCIKCLRSEVFPGHNAGPDEKVCESCKSK